jgi:hypothetical protein
MCGLWACFDGKLASSPRYFRFWGIADMAENTTSNVQVENDPISTIGGKNLPRCTTQLLFGDIS